MWCSRSLFCLTLLLYGAFGECFGIALVPKDKRGWTLNSAGYLLGPPLLPFHSHLPKADAQQTLPNRGGLAGKRDAMQDLYSLGPDSLVHAAQRADDHILQILMDFLSYLNLQDQRATSRLPLRLPEESMQQQ
ncbi:galanin peptides-like [Varanus komodoensis]|uniref:galanin peptides-like n=1 Tax=Varanus komodoensis TaxID=61221 RepID=UPI001CF7AB07|nr:galanin peptides-like [Varanus komodoensis]